MHTHTHPHTHARTHAARMHTHARTHTHTHMNAHIHTQSPQHHYTPEIALAQNLKKTFLSVTHTEEEEDKPRVVPHVPYSNVDVWSVHIFCFTVYLGHTL